MYLITMLFYYLSINGYTQNKNTCHCKTYYETEFCLGER